ncbi:hypothetical protein M9H77_03061 [Catharanthus roseus]|uniref:Uncharacterized protein n=1 Tax=Catharanthus roseus TaxID=4058 RepID=A0ACC0CA24_CATRO|nr:hypothetical protein M9H77_03061 [Catharanthus roseus]
MNFGEKKKVRLDDDDEDEEEEVPVKYRGEKSTIEDNWKLYVDERHNYKIDVYSQVHAQAARLTDDQLKLTEEFSRCQAAPQNFMASLLEKNPDCAVDIKQTIYNAPVKMKKKRMEGRNMVVRMTPRGKTFTVATAFMRNEKVETCEWVLQQLKNLYFESPKLVVIVTDKESGYLFDEWLNLCAPMFVRVWTEKGNDKNNSVIAHLYYNMYTPLKLEDVHIFWRSLKMNGLSGIGGQQSAQETDLQKQQLDFTGILQEFSTSHRPRFFDLLNEDRVPDQGLVRVPVKEGDWENVVGDGNCVFRVLSYLLYNTKNQWPKDGFAPRHCWIDAPNQLILAANTFNLCIVLIVK